MRSTLANIPAEVAVLGASLLDHSCCLKVVTSLTVDDFCDRGNQLIFEALHRLFATGQTISPQAVCEVLINDNNLALVGGYDAIIELADQVTFIEHTDNHIRILKDKTLLRQLVDLFADVDGRVDKIEASVGDFLAEVEKQVLDITRRRKVGDFTTLRDVADQVQERLRLTPSQEGVFSGFRDLDGYLHGFQPSDMIILAARPSTGKTALALSFALNAALNKKRVAIFSLEMAAIRLVERMVSTLSLVNLEKLKTYKYLSAKDISKLGVTLTQMKELDIFIDDSSYTTLPDIQAKARKIEDLDLIIIDYIGLISSPPGKRAESRQFEVAEYSRGLKAMARELNVPVIVLSQMTRESAKRKGDSKDPMLSDIRDSGAIEQDADVVLMLAKNEKSTETETVIDVHITKHRNGATGKIQLVFAKETQRFLDAAKGDAQ